MDFKKSSVSFLFLFLILISLSSFVSSAPPQFQVSDSMLDIEMVTPENHMAGEDYKVHIHVYNTTAPTNSYLTNTTTNCFLHLYNLSSGSHLIEEEMGFDSNGIDFDFLILGGNFTVGEVTVLTYCNTTELVGFNAREIMITNNGQALSISNAIIYVLLATLSFLIFIGMAWFGVGLPFRNPKNEFNKTIGIERLKYAKMGASFLSYAFLVWFINLIYILSNNLSAFPQFTGFYLMIFNILMALVWPLFVVMWVIFFYVAAKDLKLMDLLSRGINP